MYVHAGRNMEGQGQTVKTEILESAWAKNITTGSRVTIGEVLTSTQGSEHLTD